MVQIFESPDKGKTVYTREFGSTERFRVGSNGNVGIGCTNSSTFLGMPIKQVSELVSIAYAAESNSTLHEALERVKILYYLSKDTDGNSKT